MEQGRLAVDRSVAWPAFLSQGAAAHASCQRSAFLPHPPLPGPAGCAGQPHALCEQQLARLGGCRGGASCGVMLSCF